MPFCVEGKHVFIIDLYFGMESITQPTINFARIWQTKCDIESRNLTVSKSSQAYVKMMRNSIGIHFVQRDLGSGSLSPEKFLKSLPLEREKMPFCLIGKFFYMIGLHFGLENSILTSDLSFKKLKNSKVWSLKINFIVRESNQASAKVMDWAKFWYSKNALRSASLLLAFSCRMLFRHQIVKKTANVCLCVKRKSSAPEYFLNALASQCTEIDTPHK